MPDLTEAWVDQIDRAIAKVATPSPLLRYYDDPVGFADNCVDWGTDSGLAPYQREVLAQLPTERRVAVRGPHGLGKSMQAAIVVLWFALTRDAKGADWKIVTTSGGWRQLIHFLWPEIQKWAPRLRWDHTGRGPFTRHELLTLLLRLQHGSAFPVASNRPELIEGAHADEVLFIYDESKAIANATFDASEGAFSTGQAYGLAMSTPGPPAGRFYDIHSRKPGYEDWWTRHVTLEEAIAAGRINEAWAEQRRRQWGEDTALFQNRVLGEFYAADEDSVIPLAWVEAAVERWHEWDDAGQPEPEGAKVLGVDVARGGADQTILAHRRGTVITRLEPYRQRDTMGVTALVQAALDGGSVLPVVDTAGVGAGVTDRLRELGVEVVAYTGAARTKRRDDSGEYGFANVRSAAYYQLRFLLDPANETGLALPPDDELLSDLTTPRRLDPKTGLPPKLRVELKEHVVERLGRSPDRGDAVVMAFSDSLHGVARLHSPAGMTPGQRPSATAGRYQRRIA